MLRSAPITVSALAVAAAFVACGGSERRAVDDAEVPDASAAPDAGPTITGDGGGNVQPDAPKCESADFVAEPVPLTLAILLDRSGSMDESRWVPATNAIRSFVDRSEVVGMEVGLQFFPSKTGGGNVAGDYVVLPVPIAPLPANVLPIINELGRTVVGGGTPMAQGLDGTIQALRRFIATNGPRAGGVVLVTDGEPSGGASSVVSAAMGGSSPPPGQPLVRTFAVGMEGASFTTLNQIAVAGGGSSTAFNVGSGAAAQQALLEALDTIRTGAIACEYVLPTPSRGKIDPDTVEIHFTPGVNDPAVAFRKVADLAACGATTGGFYYDDPAAPTRVLLCPASCTQVGEGTPEAEVEVAVGCILDVN